MKVRKSVLIADPEEKHAIFRVETIYDRANGSGLLQEYGELEASDTFGRNWARRSADGGRSWSDPKVVFTPEKTEAGVLREGEAALLLDGKRNCVVRFFNYHLYPGGRHTREVTGLTKIYYQISLDQGDTYQEAKQIIVKGGTPEKWVSGVEYGKNSMMISFCTPLVDSRGRILLPCHRFKLMPESVGTYEIPIEAGCLIGNWSEDGDIEWEFGDVIHPDLTQTARGLFEPAIAELTDGRLLMICRGSNARMDPSVPGYKWKSLSEDGGYTWQTPQPWSYEEGELFFSPSTGSRLIRHSRNGKLYWVGNIVPENPGGNWPRYPLQIAEVDEKRLSLIRSSVVQIDTRNPEDSEKLQLSNFRVYEDRDTGEIVVTLARLYEKSNEDAYSPAWQYRIEV